MSLTVLIKIFKHKIERYVVKIFCLNKNYICKLNYFQRSKKAIIVQNERVCIIKINYQMLYKPKLSENYHFFKYNGSILIKNVIKLA